MKNMRGFMVAMSGQGAPTLTGEKWTPRNEEEAYMGHDYELPLDFPIAGFAVKNVTVGLNGQIDFTHIGEDGWSDADGHRPDARLR